MKKPIIHLHTKMPIAIALAMFSFAMSLPVPAATVGPEPIGNTSGHFDNPTPTQNPENPYFFRGPSYTGMGTSSIGFGSPLIEINGFLQTLGDGQGHSYFDREGHFMHSTFGAPIVDTRTEAEGGPHIVSLSELPQYVNDLTFHPESFSADLGDGPFVLGRLEYANRTASLGTEITSVDLNIHTSPLDPFNGHLDQSLLLRIGIFTTENLGTPEENADFIYMLDYPEFGSFRVLEGASTSVELLGEFGSLHFRGFGEVDNPAVGFVSPSTPASVPEPLSTGTCVLASFATLARVERRGRRHFIRST